MIWRTKTDFAWERSYKEAKMYYEKNGHLDVRLNFVTDNGFKLGRWLYRHRSEMKLGSLSAEKKDLLDAIGMIWDKPTEAELRWQTNYMAAKAYYEENGNLEVPFNYRTKDGFALGTWLTRTRMVYLGKAKGDLNQAQISQLEAIGMKWGCKKELEWEHSYEEAKKYYERHGHLNMSSRYRTESGLWLGQWVYKYRKAAENPDGVSASILTEERRMKLEAIGWEKSVKRSVKA